MHRHAVAGRGHAVLADAPVDIAAGEVRRRDLGRGGDFGVVGGGQVGRAGDEFRHGGRDHVERRLARLARRDLRRVGGELSLVGVDDAVEVLGKVAADAPLELGARSRRSSAASLSRHASFCALPRAPTCAPGGEDVVRARQTVRKASSRFLRAPATSAAPGASPCALLVPALVGKPKPIVVLQAIIVGRSDVLRGADGVEDRVGSCPSIRLAFQPADSKRIT